jgi:mRNA interferase RelE/StbE
LAWRIEPDIRADKELAALNKQAQREIARYLRERIATEEDPRRFGKALRGDLQGLWRYRVGDYHLVCQLRDDAFVVLVVRIGHRREVYD